MGPCSAFPLGSDAYEASLMGYGMAFGLGYGGTCWKSGSGGATNCGASAGALTTTLGGLGHMVQIPWWGSFICLLADVGLGLRYCVTPAGVRLGHPLR